MVRRVLGDLSIAVLTATISVLLVLVSGPFAVLHPIKGVWTELERVEVSDASVRLPGLRSQVKVVYDGRLVPHVFAADELDAFRALGYVHARDRLWQMDVQRRLASGRLSEIVGEAGLRTDTLMRVIGLQRSARATAEWLRTNHPDVHSVLIAYSEGVNAAIEEMKTSGRLPLMFKLLNYEPELWKPEDSLVWARFMAWTLTGFWYPLLSTALAVKLGPSEAMKLYPVRHYYIENVTVVPGDGSIGGLRLGADPDLLDKLNWFEEWATGVDFTDKELARRLFEFVNAVSGVAGFGRLDVGSNNWVVSPRLSATGGPMLADDPHLSLNLPSVWYEVHLVTGELNARGVTLPGVPFVIIGFNEHVAWGLTNSQIGVTDFYLERVRGNQYFFKGEWREMRRLEETIRVRGGGERVITVNLTVHGPVFHHNGVYVSMKWTAISGFNDDGSGVTRESVAAYRVMRAKSLAEVVEALRYWDVPSQNWAVIDKQGNYGIVVPGLFPYRTVRLPTGESINVIGSRSILNGTGAYEWEGFVPYEHVPMTINPARGFAAAPNQQTAGSLYPYYILAGWYDPGARAQRIHALLASKELHSVEDFMRYQNDVYLWFAASTVPRLLELAVGFDGLTSLERSALEELRRWDHRMSRGSVAPTLWWAWFSALYDEAFTKRFRERGLSRSYLPPESTLVWLIHEEPNSSWFGGDLRRTARAAFTRALEWLTSTFGPDLTGWTWGKVHRLRVGHLSSSETLSIGPLPHDGASGTLMNAGFPYDLDAVGRRVYVTTGPSWKMIVSFVDGRPLAYGVLPGGQSDSPLSDFYSDSFDEWYEYRYHVLGFPRSPEEVSDRLMVLTLSG